MKYTYYGGLLVLYLQRKNSFFWLKRVRICRWMDQHVSDLHALFTFDMVLSESWEHLHLDFHLIILNNVMWKYLKHRRRSKTQTNEDI